MINNTKPTRGFAFVPNLLTITNLLCGAVGLFFAFNARTDVAFALMVAGAFFDFFDGFAARLLKVSSELGKQLDSLADLVTFGLLPAAMVFSYQYNAATNSAGDFQSFNLIQWGIVISPLLIVVFSALRLAKFNIDYRQADTFIGLPTPANALFFASICYVATNVNDSILTLVINPFVLFVLTLLFSFLLIAELPLFSLKFKTLAIKANLIRYVFLLISIVVIIFMKIQGIALVILIYIFMSIVSRIVSRNKS